MRTKISILLFILFFTGISTYAQGRKEKNQPYIDQKMYHLGFLVGIHGQDMNIMHTGFESSGEVWFAGLPSYSAGFSVGIIGDRYINEHFNIRLPPTLHFGEKNIVFKEQTTGTEYKTTLRCNYLTMPLQIKFNAGRIDNYRPYLTMGGYASMNITPKKNEALRLKPFDYGLEFGLGCNFYLPMFKLCPELKFSLGLADVIDKDRSDLSDKEMLKYTQSISSGKNRMISLVFNFE